MVMLVVVLVEVAGVAGVAGVVVLAAVMWGVSGVLQFFLRGVVAVAARVVVAPVLAWRLFVAFFVVGVCRAGFLA